MSAAEPSKTKAPAKKQRGGCFLVAGAVAGASSRTAVAPLARLRIMFQMGAVSSDAAVRASTKRITITQAMKGIYAEEGYYGFFRGNLTNVLRIIPYSATRFWTFDMYKLMLTKDGTVPMSSANSFAGGALAGLTATFVSYPLDLLRARFSLQSASQQHYSSVWNGVTTILKTEGPQGFFKGLAPTIMGILPYSGINFWLYEDFKNAMTTLPFWEDNHKLSITAAGAASGTIAQTLTFPLDVIRRRMQVKGFGDMKVPYHGTWDAVQKIVAMEGFTGLYRGLWPTYARVIPATAVQFLAYEWTKELVCQS